MKESFLSNSCCLLTIHGVGDEVFSPVLDQMLDLAFDPLVIDLLLGNSKWVSSHLQDRKLWLLLTWLHSNALLIKY